MSKFERFELLRGKLYCLRFPVPEPLDVTSLFQEILLESMDLLRISDAQIRLRFAVPADTLQRWKDGESTPLPEHCLAMYQWFDYCMQIVMGLNFSKG